MHGRLAGPICMRQRAFTRSDLLYALTSRPATTLCMRSHLAGLADSGHPGDDPVSARAITLASRPGTEEERILNDPLGLESPGRHFHQRSIDDPRSDCRTALNDDEMSTGGRRFSLKYRCSR